MSTTIEFLCLSDVFRLWALPQLRDAQKRFAREPNALNWQLCLKAMLVYQQLEYAQRSVSVDKGKLWFALESNPIGQWPDVICRATTGLTLRELNHPLAPIKR